MTEKEYFIDDRIIVPDNIKKMTKDELKNEIAKLEKKLFGESSSKN